MRVGVLHNLGPGGALRFVEETARRLAETDEVVVATWSDRPDPIIPGVGQAWWPRSWIRLPPPLHPFGDLARSFVASRGAGRRAEAAGFDVVLAYSCQWAQAPELLRHVRGPSVYYAQEGRRRSLEAGYLPTTSMHSRLGAPAWRLGRATYDAVGRLLDRRAMRGARHVLTNSAFTARNLAAAYGVRATVVEPGVDADRFRPGRGAHDGPVLFVGALDPTKGADLVIEAVGSIPASRRPAVHLVYNRASPAYVEVIDTLAATLNVRLVHRGGISDEQLADEYRSASMLAAAARAEPYGLTIPEATASGTPTVAVAEGGYVETVVEGVNGILVDRTAQGLAAGIDAILTAEIHLDRPYMAAWARERWSWERCTRLIREACVRAIEEWRR